MSTFRSFIKRCEEICQQIPLSEWILWLLALNFIVSFIGFMWYTIPLIGKCPQGQCDRPFELKMWSTLLIVFSILISGLRVYRFWTRITYYNLSTESNNLNQNVTLPTQIEVEP